MTGQPDFYLPTREPLLPVGAHGAADDADLELGWSYEPATDAVGTVIPYDWATSNLSSVRIDLGDFGGDLYAIMRIGTFSRIDKISTSGALIRTINSSNLGISGAAYVIDVDADGPVIAAGSNRIYRLNDDLGDPTLLFSVPLTLSLEGLALVGDEIWLLVNLPNRVIRYSLSGTNLGSVTLPLSGALFGLAVTDTHIYVLDSTHIRAHTYAGAAVTSLDATLTTGSEQGLVSLPDAFWTGSTAAITEGLTRYDLIGLAMQDFSLRRSLNSGNTWRYFNDANSGSSQWASADTPQPVSLLTSDGIVREPCVQHFRIALDEFWDNGNNEHQFQARNRDTAGTWSPWSDSLDVLPSTPPTVDIDTPATDDIDLSAEFNPRWTVSTEQDYYRVTTRVGDQVFQESGFITSTATQHDWGNSGTDQLLIDLPVEPMDGDLLDITLEVWNDRYLRTVVSRRGIVRYLPPEPPEDVVVTANNTRARVVVVWEAQAAGASGEPATATIELYRRVEGGDPVRIYIDDDPLTNDADTVGTFTDHWAPFERLLEYRPLALGVRGQSDDATLWVQ